MKMTKNTILITGGTSGIGFEFIKQLSELDNTSCGQRDDERSIRNSAGPKQPA
jgi:short-subunit dehydrogenase involved in D-alanine esterification of teichoic acids